MIFKDLHFVAVEFSYFQAFIAQLPDDVRCWAEHLLRGPLCSAVRAARGKGDLLIPHCFIVQRDVV